eukprot:GHVT01015593.1.p1 GENE.GHVT01015593.1~~GHVT01015593.1.p1  ORF type:complete len:202 (+),score=40.17 GHVT01015593.1:1237-1842(+)
MERPEAPEKTAAGESSGRPVASSSDPSATSVGTPAQTTGAEPRKAAADTSMGEGPTQPHGSPNTSTDDQPVAACPDDPLVQYVAVREDLMGNLNWPVGAVITQACHASLAAIAAAPPGDASVRAYLASAASFSMRKVTLGVRDEDQLKRLSGRLAARGVSHAIWLEQPEAIHTALATKPDRKSNLSRHFKGLKLFNDTRLA